MTLVKWGGLPTQALVEDELGHGCWGVIQEGHELRVGIPTVRGVARGKHDRVQI